MARKERPHTELYSLDSFLHDVRFSRELPIARKYCFVLGSGASVPSGILCGYDLVTVWITELFRRANPDKPVTGFESWATAETLQISQFDLKNRSASYGDVYAKLFGSDEEIGRAYLRKVMAGARPSFGYSMLAQILSKTAHRIVVTTNFDHLTEEAVHIYTGTEAATFGHSELAKFVAGEHSGPVVVKIHGDVRYETYNLAEEISTLRSEWRNPLRVIFGNYTPIFIGYGGHDKGFMDFLAKELTGVTIPSPFIWTYHSRRATDGPPSHALFRALKANVRIRCVAIPGFDEFMFLFGEALGMKKLDKVLEGESALRVAKYRSDFEKTVAALRINALNPRRKSFGQYIRNAILSLVETGGQHDWWEWHTLANNASTTEETQKLYQEGLKTLPQSPELRARYGEFLADVRPNDPEAEKTVRDALSDAEKTFGTEHPATVMVLSALANVLRARGDYEGAEPFARKALEIRERTLGSDHVDTIESVNDLALLLHDKGDLLPAEALYDRALDGFKNILGDDHPYTLVTQANLAILLSEEPDARDALVRAESLQREALQKRERLFGPFHADTLQSVNSLAVILQKLGQLDEAEGLHVRAVKDFERILGPEHQRTVAALFCLASFLALKGDNPQAITSYRLAIDRAVKTLGEDHPTTKHYEKRFKEFEQVLGTPNQVADDH